MVSRKTNHKRGDLELAIKLFKTTSLPVEEILRAAKLGNTRFYSALKDRGIKRSRRIRLESEEQDHQAVNPRQHERRDCKHYYTQCLETAARDDTKCVPCQKCQFWEWGDNSAHEFITMAVYLEQIGWG